MLTLASIKDPRAALTAEGVTDCKGVDMDNPTPKKPPTDDPRCGIYAGWLAHRKRWENPCEKCKEAKREDSRRFRERHPRKKAEQGRQYRLKYPEKNKAIQKAYKVKNREKIIANAKIYRLKNKDKIAIYTAEYRAKFPEKRRERLRRYRAKKAGNGIEPYTEKQVIKLYGTMCYICKGSIDMNAPRIPPKHNWQRGFQIDHVIPISKGGPDTLENVRPAHGFCNLSKGNRV